MAPAPAPLYLIDGSSYIYRAFFALPPLTAPSGAPVNAVYGFTTMMLKLLREVQPTHIVAVFDAPGGTFRDQLFEAYKANRPSMPSDLAAQIPLVREAITALRVRELQVAGVEADDVIATLTTRYSAAGVACVVITGDKDLMQLVGPFVRLWDTMRDRWIDEAAVRERFGVAPAQVVEVMALMGDSSDNIPGVKGIGEKTATALIQRFGGVESLLGRLDEVERSDLRGAKKVAALLRANAEAARLSRELALVRRDVPLNETLDDLRYQGPDHAALRALFARLGFQSLVRELTDAAPPLTVSTRLLDSAPAVCALHERARQLGAVAMATLGHAEGDGQAPTTRASALLLAVNDDTADEVSQVTLAEEPLRTAVARLLGDSAVEIVAHDLKRDLLRLDPSMIIGGPGFDTMVASYLLDASTTHRLEDVARDVLNITLPEFRGEVGSEAAGVAVMPRLAAELRVRLEA
ncbi:MAG TPA: 5'-3' exonuclease H3TH domain-containing protein, partial [Candidatus Kryptonia bacterium]|nr:5'-3' exonuclease H3TH domain-containing protein [Candidatus Kryptonia bacterium]